MSKVKTLHIINHNRLLDIKDDTLYITLTKIMHKKLLAKSVPSKYLFEDDGQCDLKKILIIYLTAFIWSQKNIIKKDGLQ